MCIKKFLYLGFKNQSLDALIYGFLYTVVLSRVSGVRLQNSYTIAQTNGREEKKETDHFIRVIVQFIFINWQSETSNLAKFLFSRAVSKLWEFCEFILLV